MRDSEATIELIQTGTATTNVASKGRAVYREMESTRQSVKWFVKAARIYPTQADLKREPACRQPTAITVVSIVQGV